MNGGVLMVSKAIGAEQRLISYRESRENPDLGSGGVCWGVISNVNLLNKRLCRIILLHFGPVTFKFHFGNTLKPHILMICRPSGRDHDSENMYD